MSQSNQTADAAGTPDPQEESFERTEDGFWEQLDNTEADENDADLVASVEPADWAGDELEAAYLRAMEALDASEASLPPTGSNSEDEASAMEAPGAASSAVELDAEEDGAGNHPVRDLSFLGETSTTPTGRLEASEAIRELSASRDSDPVVSQPPAVMPRHVIEACLFVGGPPLTSKKLSAVLRGEFSVDFIENEIEELNSLYLSEGRPYEIRLGEGGYRMLLREDFDRIRHKVYGLGPKEVRLTQDALEILALVAYQQPITCSEIEAMGKSAASITLRQLLRRELISLERPAEKGQEITYRTTPRFLSLFGIRSLNELPRHEQVNYK